MDQQLTSPTRLIGDVFALIYRDAIGYTAQLGPDAVLALSGDAGAYWLNTAVIADDPGADAAVQRAIAVFQQRALPGWILHDDALSDRVTPIAHQAGLTDAGTVPFMVYRGPAAPPRVATGPLPIGRVTDLAGVRAANQITAAAFAAPSAALDRVWGAQLLAMPGFDLFLAWDADRPVGTVMTTRQGPFVGIWTMGVVPERQRQGIGRQLLQAVLQHHQARDTTAFYLIAFEAGRRLYEQTGFRIEAQLRVWIAAPC